MTTIARYIGGAGTGKTRLLMDRLGDVLEAGVDPMRVGFVSFTRAARAEAASRAAEVAGVSERSLTDDGWFKTLHSICYKSLGVPSGQLIADDKEGREWLRANIGIEHPADSEEGLEAFASRTDEERALDVWSLARSRMESLRDTIDWLGSCGAEVGDEVFDVIRRYEEAKTLDDRCDFTDMLARFAGLRFRVDGEPEEVRPEGDPPPLHVWFFDEQQDTSPLLDRVCRRLCTGAAWVYVCGDPFQSVYGFTGSDGRIFQEWEVAKEAIMPQSFRCAPEIHAYGEDCLRLASDYWDRGIKPAGHEGSVERCIYRPWLFESELNADSSWLILTRTNHQARRVMAKLKGLGIPWEPTKGLGGWNRPAWRNQCLAAYVLQNGGEVSWADWKSFASKAPATMDGRPVLQRGLKAEMAVASNPARVPHVNLDNLEQAGAGEVLIDMADKRRLLDLIDDGCEFERLTSTYGPAKASQLLERPPIRVGTVHSVKGTEADNVIWIASSTRRIVESCKRSQPSFNEECRVSYVAATRARKRLIVAHDPAERFKMITP